MLEFFSKATYLTLSLEMLVLRNEMAANHTLYIRLCNCRCLDSILHAEHKTILEEMRTDFDLTLSTKNKTVTLDDFPSLGRKAVADQESGAFMNNSMKSDDIDKEQKDETDSKIPLPFGFTLDLNLLLDFSLKTAKRNPIKSSRYLSCTIYLLEKLRLYYPGGKLGNFCHPIINTHQFI